MSVDGEALEWIRLDHVLAYIQLAVATCVIYDHLTTLDLELELIWRRPKWTTVQYLFLLTRYFGDTCQIFSTYVVVRHVQLNAVDQCRLLNIVQGTLFPVVLWAMQGIMMYRISSMYNHTRKIIVLLVSSFAVEFVVLVVTNIFAIRFGTVIVVPPPGVNICKKSDATFGFIVWLPIILFELLVFGLAVMVALDYFHSLRPFHRRHRNSLAYILLRDSVIFPLLAMSACILSITSWFKLPFLASQLTQTLSTLLPVMLGCRLILNLREAYYQPFSEEMTPNLHNEPDYDQDSS